MSETGLIPLGGPLQAFGEWLSGTWLNYVATHYVWVWPAMETIHFLALGLLVGTIGVLDLRLIGVARQLPLAPFQQLVPWGVAAFIVNILTGAVFFAGAPFQYIYNFAVQMKVLLILIAGVNILVFYAGGISRRIFMVAAGEPVPLAGRITGLVSLTVWIGVMYWGRMLTFYRPPWVVPPH